jgi:hypothetical protein
VYQPCPEAQRQPVIAAVVEALRAQMVAVAPALRG